jgi:hypothetical protein
MRTVATMFITAAAFAFPASALADGPEWCQAEPCTDPVGHFTKPVKPVVDAVEALLEPAALR